MTAGTNGRGRDGPAAPNPATAPVVELDGLSVRLGGRPVLRDLTAALRGEAIGLLGPNGAGKTTLLHTLLGFHTPHAGTARVLGHDVRTDIDHVRARVGYMPEQEAYLGGRSAVAQVQMLAELSGLPPEAALERAHEALYYVGLGEARYRRLDSYSLGMRQLVKLAQAIAHGPRLLLLDEPTNGLDPAARRRMIELVRDMRASGEMTIVLSSHLLRDVEATCEQVLVLRDGRIAAQQSLGGQPAPHDRLLELELRGDDAPLIDDLAARGCECAVLERGRVRLVLPADMTVGTLFARAAAHNVQVRRLGYRRETLEQFFLRAVEEGQATGDRRADPDGPGPDGTAEEAHDDRS